MAIHSFKDLDVWRKSIMLAEKTYELTRELPADERFGLSLQLRRAAVSIPSNIAEGFGRESLREYLHFLAIAKGSLNEFETQLIIALGTGLLTEDRTEPMFPLIEDIRRMLVRLAAALRPKLGDQVREAQGTYEAVNGYIDESIYADETIRAKCEASYANG